MYSLRRNEIKANWYHAKADKILRNDVHPGVKQNIKIAKLLLLKGTWCPKYSIPSSEEYLIESFHMLEEMIGSSDNYFGANCYL